MVNFVRSRERNKMKIEKKDCEWIWLLLLLLAVCCFFVFVFWGEMYIVKCLLDKLNKESMFCTLIGTFLSNGILLFPIIKMGLWGQYKLANEFDFSMYKEIGKPTLNVVFSTALLAVALCIMIFIGATTQPLLSQADDYFLNRLVVWILTAFDILFENLKTLKDTKLDRKADVSIGIKIKSVIVWVIYVVIIGVCCYFSFVTNK